MIRFIDVNKDRRSGKLAWGIEPIAKTLGIAPSTYPASKTRAPSARAVRDAELRPVIARVHKQNFVAYGADKMWDHLNEVEGIRVARCTVERLMGHMGLSGVRRGRSWVKTTIADDGTARPADLVDRDFAIEAPNRLWLADLTYVKSHSGLGVCGVHHRRLLEDGRRLWDIDNGYTASLSDTSPASAHDVHDDDLVWCPGDCATLTITDTSDLSSQEHHPPEGYSHFVDSNLSPDGRWVAALLGHQGEPEGRAIWILDRRNETTHVVADPGTHVDYLAWSSDTSQLFATSWGYGQDHTNLWRYDLTNDRFAAVVLPFGGTLTPVAVDRSLADAYINDQIRPPDDCTAPMGEPSGRTGICIFGY